MISTDRVPAQAFKALTFALTCFVLFSARPVAAEDFTVNTTADSGDGSLRDGITDSNDATDDTWMLPEIRAEWHHQLLDRDRAIDANFASTTANPGFKIRGADLQRNSASVGVGWTVRACSGFEAASNYDLGIDTDRLTHAIGLRVATHW